MGTGRRRNTVLVALTLVIGTAPVACSSSGDPETLPPIASIPVGLVSTTAVTTTTAPPVDPRLVDDCVEYVMFGAFTQNPLLGAMWDAADRDAGTLRDDCESLGLTDPAGLQALSDGLASLDSVLATMPDIGSTTTSTSQPPPPPAPRATTTTEAPIEPPATPPLAPPATDEPAPAPEPCPPGSHLNDAGTCEPDAVDTSQTTTTVTV